MNQRHISLIGAPTDIGAGARGASMGPEALRVAGLAATLEGHGLEVQDRGNLAGPANPWLPPVDGYRHLNEGVAWHALVHAAVLTGPATPPLANGYERFAYLVDWVERGVAPGKTLTVTAGERTMPLCSYPAYPRYVSGPASAAASYTCATP